MKKTIFIAITLLIGITHSAFYASGQEYAGPLHFNQTLNHTKKAAPARAAKKTTTTLTLPFFDDFTGYSIYPDSSKWTDFEVFINNTMCVNPVTRGVATFDALNQIGIPYDSFSNTNFRYADSLTSQPIDLTGYTPGDSIYLSFFYQPQGNSYYPLYQDSLALFMTTHYGGFVKVWSAAGTSLKPFQQVMIPVTDSLFLDNAAFQFRFVNIAALYWADAIWNLDYVRMDRNRSVFDTAVNDIGFAGEPSFLLNDYTSMPYRQFMAYKAGETAPQYTNTIHNNWGVPEPITYGFSATALNTGSSLLPTVFNSTSLTSNNIQTVSNSAYSASIPLTAVSRYDKVVFENKYFIQQTPASGTSPNDTIVKDIIFDNYLAYDDGSAEKSYFLNLSSTLPGKIGIEYHLNQADTMRGMAIYFGRQVPFSTYKTFSILVYSQLAGVNGAVSDDILYQQDLNGPMYVDTINHFVTYKFDTPVPLPPGTFYAGTIQAPASGNDSIYFGLDVNRVGGNHAYFNVDNLWQSSLITGAIMMRPLLGQPVTGSGVHDIINKNAQWSVVPNPAKDVLRFNFEGDNMPIYRISDIQGRAVSQGEVPREKTIDVSGLVPGMYFVSLISDGIPMMPQKFIKL